MPSIKVNSERTLSYRKIINESSMGVMGNGDGFVKRDRSHIDEL